MMKEGIQLNTCKEGLEATAGNTKQPCYSSSNGPTPPDRNKQCWDPTMLHQTQPVK